MADAPFTAVGRVVKTHGLKGEVSVMSFAETSFDVFIDTEVWFVPPPARVRTARVVSVRPGPKGELVTLDGVGDIDTASALNGCEILVRTEDLPPQWEEFEDHDALGLMVTDVERGELGEIVEVIETGANDVWVVEGRFGEVLLPVIDDVILSVDYEAQTVQVRLLDGLMPGEAEEL